MKDRTQMTPFQVVRSYSDAELAHAVEIMEQRIAADYKYDTDDYDHDAQVSIEVGRRRRLAQRDKEGK